jgi:hypothetical protein
MLLADVVVSHSLTASRVARRESAGVLSQVRKNKKYAGVASRLGAELMNISVDTCGGLASGALLLAQAVGEEGESWSAGTWTSGSIQRYLLSGIAVAVQRGNALAMLSGLTRAGHARLTRGPRSSEDIEREKQT